MQALLSGGRVRVARRLRGRRDQRLQLQTEDLRHHGPLREHRVGRARGRRPGGTWGCDPIGILLSLTRSPRSAQPMKLSIKNSGKATRSDLLALLVPEGERLGCPPGWTFPSFLSGFEKARATRSTYAKGGRARSCSWARNARRRGRGSPPSSGGRGGQGGARAGVPIGAHRGGRSRRREIGAHSAGRAAAEGALLATILRRRQRARPSPASGGHRGVGGRCVQGRP